jgi:hypothetical protein
MSFILSCVRVAASSSSNSSQQNNSQAPVLAATSSSGGHNPWSSLRAAAQGIFRSGTQEGLDDAISSVQDDIAEGRSLVSNEFDEFMSEANRKRPAEDHHSHDDIDSDGSEDLFGEVYDP